MIGVDTNVLLRLYVADDERQHQVALRFLSGRSRTSPMFISVVVLVEFSWTLRRSYGYRTDAIHALLSQLAQTQDVVFERQELVQEALDQASRDGLDLPDLLIAMTNQAAGCERTMTFDKKMARAIPGMELLA